MDWYGSYPYAFGCDGADADVLQSGLSLEEPPIEHSCGHSQVEHWDR